MIVSLLSELGEMGDSGVEYGDGAAEISDSSDDGVRGGSSLTFRGDGVLKNSRDGVGEGELETRVT